MVINFDNFGGGGGSQSGYTLPVATQSTLGGIKVGQNLTIDSGGTLSADAQAVSVATTATTGVVQVGSGLSITSGGVLSTDIDLSDYAEKSDLEDYATVESLSGYVETSAMSGYQTTDAMSGYQTTQAMSAYQTTEGMSGYVQTSAMSGYVETSDLEEYIPQYAMALKTVGDDNYKVINYNGSLYSVDKENYDETDAYVKIVKDLYETNISFGISGQTEIGLVEISSNEGIYVYIGLDKNGDLYYTDSEVTNYYEKDGNYDVNGFVFRWNNGGKHIYFSQRAMYIDASPLTSNFEIWKCVGQNVHIASEDDLGLVKIGEGITLSEDGTISVEGGEEIEKTNTTNWGTVQLGNGIGLEVNDNVIFGVSAGENYVFGNGEGVGYDPNNSKGGGMKAPLPSAYTQYDLDIYDDYGNCIDFVDGGGNISLSLFLDGQDGNVVIFDCDATRYIKIYRSSGVCYLEASTENQRGAKSLPHTATTIEFSTSSPYKDFMIHYDGSGKIEVYESYDNYDTPIAELSDVDFGETISHIQLFDSSTSMNETGIGTISINNTDYIKPYYEYDGNTVTNVGFVLRKRSYIEIM